MVEAGKPVGYREEVWNKVVKGIILLFCEKADMAGLTKKGRLHWRIENDGINAQKII